MKLGILAIVLGVLGIGGYISFQLSDMATFAPQITANGVLTIYGVRDWTFGVLFAIVGLVLIALGAYRMRIKRKKAVR